MNVEYRHPGFRERGKAIDRVVLSQRFSKSVPACAIGNEEQVPGFCRIQHGLDCRVRGSRTALLVRHALLAAKAWVRYTEICQACRTKHMSNVDSRAVRETKLKSSGKEGSG